MKAIKTKEVVKFLKAQGWSIKRSKGPHDVWTSPDGKQLFALPRHTECAPGVVRQLGRLLDGIPDSWK